MRVAQYRVYAAMAASPGSAIASGARVGAVVPGSVEIEPEGDLSSEQAASPIVRRNEAAANLKMRIVVAPVEIVFVGMR
jgi:hypothetical protein